MKYLFLLLLPLLAACSNFDHRWKSESIPNTPNTLAGRWTGEWQSFTSHRGQLRAIIQPDLPPATRVATTQPGGAATRIYHCSFKATYGFLNAAEYDVDFTATPTADGETFTGSKDLGAFAGGVYHYQGTLRQDNLQTSYTAPLDHGTFTLHRAP